ncbi:BLOC-1-related complex subunit 8 isoform X1 [Gallus gallus]|uniref:BLOC-1-related complex subunit 8 isoform X1 n=1 Tax=Gallus gallus TaxID=9031 RepID=UPI000739F487|nr:BLOC-1-related complex subunit 8 isoform X1 [Gallus gallus]|eukprot:XP_015155561.1 BLOC-1-related complex subunit 8 isoform X1 [Gallus gallus]
MEEPEMQLKLQTNSQRACMCWPTSPLWPCTDSRSTSGDRFQSSLSTSLTCRAGRSRAKEPSTPWSTPAVLLPHKPRILQVVPDFRQDWLSSAFFSGPALCSLTTWRNKKPAKSVKLHRGLCLPRFPVTRCCI